MPKARIGETKNDYESMLYTYIHRRSVMYTRWLLKPDFNYLEKSKKIRSKIKVCIAAIRKFQKRQETMETANECMKQFLGINMKRVGSHVGTNKIKQQAKSIFYKYLLEKGIKASYIGPFCGMKHSDTITRNRRAFNKSFSSNDLNRENYHRFLKYIKEYKK